jgi:hypothetical protein
MSVIRILMFPIAGIRKLFWFIWIRVKHKYLYSIQFKPQETECPICGWDTSCESQDPYNRNYLGPSNSTHPLSFDQPRTWDDSWKCPKCGNVFVTDGSEF